MKEYVDILERVIQPGDFVLYCTSAGRSAILKFGIVVDLGIFKANDWVDRRNDNKYISAITLDYWLDHPSYAETKGFDLQNNGKPVRLTLSERIYKMPLIDIPAVAYKLLTNAMHAYQLKGGNK